FTVVVVTGDPPPIPQILYTALTAGAASQYAVTGLSCGPELGRDELLRASHVLSDPSTGARTTSGDPPTPSPAAPLLVFDDAAQLSDEQIELIFENLCMSTRPGDHRNTAAVLLARPNFLARLEQPALRFWLAERVLAARLRFQELGGGEVMAFIRHQLPAGEAERAFSEETVAAIANVSGGDPILVNRFARRLLDHAAAKTAKSFGRSSSNPTVVAPTERPVEKSRTTSDERPQDAAVPETVLDLGEQIWTWRWPGINAMVRLSAVIVVWLVCFGGAGAFFPDPPEEKVSILSTLTGDASAASRESELSVGEAARPGPAAAASAARAPVATLMAENRTAVAARAPGASPSEVAPTRAADAQTGPPEPIVASRKANPLMSPAGAGPTAGGIALSATLEAAPAIATLTPITPATRLRLSPAEITALIARGDQLLGTGDVASARLFYERAADVGDGEAALKLGMTFDPAFLSFGRLSGARGDPATAIAWYRRAHDLGQAEAEIPLKRLNSEFPK
ncbi:MAG TPA: hypothetical protein VGG62_06610, partial [Terracidiphilus sp.]